MKASLAKTDMNPEAWDCRQPRKSGAACVAGNLDELLGLSSSGFAAGSTPSLVTGKEVTSANWQDPTRRAVALRQSLGGGGEGTPVSPTRAPQVTANPNDTLVIMGIGDKSLTE